MARPIVHLFPCLKDNYGFLIHDPASGETACIDTPDPAAILAEADAKGWKITQVWNTHWHPDHAGGNIAIKDATGCAIIGPKGEAGKIPGIDRAVGQGDLVQLGPFTAEVIDTPGHTLGHIAYSLADCRIAFVGDTLFALGCGRLFEGTPAQMWESLLKLRALDDATQVYCAHEYTQANARFALSIDPDHEPLQIFAREVDAARANNEPTIPTSIAAERRANPFLRADDPDLQARMGHAGDAVATFAEMRERKNRF